MNLMNYQDVITIDGASTHTFQSSIKFGFTGLDKVKEIFGAVKLPRFFVDVKFFLSADIESNRQEFIDAFYFGFHRTKFEVALLHYFYLKQRAFE